MELRPRHLQSRFWPADASISESVMRLILAMGQNNKLKLFYCPSRNKLPPPGLRNIVEVIVK